MRAPNGNIQHLAGLGSDKLNFSSLSSASGPNGTGYGVDYRNQGGNDRVLGTTFDDNFMLSAGVEIIDGPAEATRSCTSIPPLR